MNASTAAISSLQEKEKANDPTQFSTVAGTVPILDASTQQRSLSMPGKNLASLTAVASTAILVSDTVVIVNPSEGNQATSM